MVSTLTIGGMFVMWLGEQITERGIGNGMSLLIFVSILERIWPSLRAAASSSSGPASVTPSAPSCCSWSWW